MPIRRIARDLKLSRNTVRKAIRGDVAAFGYERTVQPLPKLGPWVGELERLVEANEGKRRRERLSLLRIFEQLQGLGYDGGYDAVRRYAMSCAYSTECCHLVHFKAATCSKPKLPPDSGKVATLSERSNAVWIL